jgi:hypothetical protein
VLLGGLGDDVLAGGDGWDLVGMLLGADILALDDDDDFELVFGYTPDVDRFDLSDVAGVNRVADLTLIDTGDGVLVGYGSGAFLLADTDRGVLESGDFLF